MFPPRLILFVSMLAMVVPAKGAEPLYEQFRPLSSLPWTTPGATRDEVIHRLYREPNQLVRSALLDEYLKSVPTAEFAHVFDLCVRLAATDSPDDLLERLMYAWGRIDPAAAWAKCEALYETIVPQNPLDVDEWGTGVVVLNPQAVTAASFWPRWDSFADGFVDGVAESGLPQPEKDRYVALEEARSNAWHTAWDAAEAENPKRGEFRNPSLAASPPTPEQSAESAKYQAEKDEETRVETAKRKFVLEILATPPAQIQARLAAAAPELWDDAILARALLRWMDGDASRGPEIVEKILELVDPRGAMRGASKLEPIPIEFLMEWALLSPASFRVWALMEKDGKVEARPGLAQKSLAVVQAIAIRDDHQSVLRWVEEPFDFREVEERNQAAFYWAEIDPANALPWIWSHDGVRVYGVAAFTAVYGPEPPRPANVTRAIFGMLDEFMVPIQDLYLYEILERWSDVDAAWCARFGARWCLRTGRYTKMRMLREWTGYLQPEDSAVDDRQYGSLRIWAMRKPDEVRKWIRTGPLEDDVRQALLWLVDHAAGGFELREGGAPPMPITPPKRK